MADEAPLFFEAHLGMLRPANTKAEEAMREIKGRVTVKITGGRANQRRRGLYWSVAALVVPLLNQAFNLTLDEDDLHDITRDKLKLYDEIELPSGDVHRKRRSTSNRAMNEAERADYTTRALALWSTWVGVDVTTLREEAEKEAA
jgi:predicted thioredoxin/glutaredoxin